MKQVPFKKPGISQPDKRFPAFCGYRKFIIVPTKVTISQMLNQMNLVQPSPTHPFNIYFNIIHPSKEPPLPIRLEDINKILFVKF
jgi:hypothetical protein